MDHWELENRFERTPAPDQALSFMADVLEAYEAATDDTPDQFADRIGPILDRAYDRFMRFHPGYLIGATPEQNRAYQSREPRREANRANREVAA